MLHQRCSPKFLSTPSARRATAPSRGGKKPPPDFYPRPPRGGRPLITRLYALADKISIHALREEGDKYWVFEGRTDPKFLSTPSARRATCKDC